MRLIPNVPKKSFLLSMPRIHIYSEMKSKIVSHANESEQIKKKTD